MWFVQTIKFGQGRVLTIKVKKCLENKSISTSYKIKKVWFFCDTYYISASYLDMLPYQSKKGLTDLSSEKKCCDFSKNEKANSAS